jgi:recombination protein RecR
MLSSLPTFTKLIQLIKRIPYVPGKHTYHIAEHLLRLDDKEIITFFELLLEYKHNLIVCVTCLGWKEKDFPCLWCDGQRDKTILCVVETWIDAIALERSRIFNGIYHILGGKISPIDGIGPDQLHFHELETRLAMLPLVEIIIGTNQTPEGEATALYLENLIARSGKKIKISYLATGIPVGTSLEYVDRITLGKALANRRFN